MVGFRTSGEATANIPDSNRSCKGYGGSVNYGSIGNGYSPKDEIIVDLEEPIQIKPLGNFDMGGLVSRVKVLKGRIDGKLNGHDFVMGRSVDDPKISIPLIIREIDGIKKYIPNI